MAAAPDWYERTLARQLQMTSMTWSTLQEHGVNEDSQLRLDFFFIAPGQSQAGVLASVLRDETDYHVEIDSRRRLLAKPTWTVVGKTQPTSVSLEVLNDWVRWMVAAGAEKGACEFDGWGAEAPQPD